MSRRDKLLKASCAVALLAAGAAAAAPQWVQLMPAGEVQTRPGDGRGPWRLADAEAVVSSTNALKDALPIDYDHAIDQSREHGVPAPAAGWIVELQARDDGIWGRVEWTEKGAAAIAAREYRFISPVFEFDPRTKEVRRLLRAGLTNDPALFLKALAARGADNEGEDMDLLKKLRAAFGLADDADEDAVVTAATKAAEAAKDTATAAAKAVAPIAKALGLADDAKAADVETAAATAAKDAGTAIAGALAPVAKALGLAADAKPAEVETAAAKATAAAAKAGDRDALATRLQALEEERATDKATAAVDGAIKAGKLIPAQRDWGIAYAQKDADAFDQFIEAQPVVVASGGSGPGGRPGAGKDGLGADEIAVCRSMGLTPEEYRKSRTAIAEREQEEAA